LWRSFGNNAKVSTKACFKAHPFTFKFNAFVFCSMFLDVKEAAFSKFGNCGYKI
jgi:hypothetical protein